MTGLNKYKVHVNTHCLHMCNRITNTHQPMGHLMVPLKVYVLANDLVHNLVIVLGR